MHLRRLFPSLLLIITVFGCAQDKASVESSVARETASADYAQAEYDAPPPETTPPALPPDTDPVVPAERVLIRTADCRLEVENIDEQVRRIEQLAERRNGYVGDLQRQNYSRRAEVSLTLRVPAAAFQAALDEIMAVAVNVDHQTINTQDVTEEYVDVQSRLKTKRAVRDRYEDILRTKAKTVEEIFQAEEQIRRLQEEIEVQEGRLRYLTQRSALSTITVSIYEPLDGSASTTPWWKELGGEIGDSLSTSVRIVKNLLLGLISIWPLLLIAGLLFWYRKPLWRRLRGRS